MSILPRLMQKKGVVDGTFFFDPYFFYFVDGYTRLHGVKWLSEPVDITKWMPLPSLRHEVGVSNGVHDSNFTLKTGIYYWFGEQKYAASRTIIISYFRNYGQIGFLDYYLVHFLLLRTNSPCEIEELSFNFTYTHLFLSLDPPTKGYFSLKPWALRGRDVRDVEIYPRNPTIFKSLIVIIYGSFVGTSSVCWMLAYQEKKLPPSNPKTQRSWLETTAQRILTLRRESV